MGGRERAGDVMKSGSKEEGITAAAGGKNRAGGQRAQRTFRKAEHFQDEHKSHTLIIPVFNSAMTTDVKETSKL